MEFYLQHKAGDNGPFLTERVQHKEKPLVHHDLGLTYTTTGYGPKIPSRYMIYYNSRWYRVYSMCYSNLSSEYVIIGGEDVKVDIYG